MASFKKRGKTWEYIISTKDPLTGKFKRITKGGFRTKAEASNAAGDKEQLIKHGYTLNAKVTLVAYFKEWIDIYKKPVISERTYTKYLTTLNSLEVYFGEMLISEINKKMYQKILNEYAKTHAPQSTSKFNNHIRQCVKNAVEEKVIIDNFTNNAVISGTDNVKKKEDKFLNYEDTKRVIAYFKERLDPKITSYYMIILAFTTGMRYGELLGLTWADIDFDNNLVDINKSYDYHTHSGFKDTKTYSSERVISIDDKTAEMFYNFKLKQQELFKQFNVTNPLNQIFYHYLEGIVSNNAVNKSLQRGLKQLNIDPLITIHGARHTYGSILIYKGIDITIVSEILGHKDSFITSKVYIHIIKELRNKNKLLMNKIISDLYTIPYKKGEPIKGNI